MPKITHLHVHSHYSLLNALPKIDNLVKKAKDYGMEAVALTDNGNLYGVIDFYKACKDNEIKPIIGIDVYVASRTRRDKEPRIDNRRTRLILIAKDNTGYRSLIRLTTDANLVGFYYKPRVDDESLTQNKDGLIAIIPFFNSDISKALLMNDFEKAKKRLSFLQNLYGTENIFYELNIQPTLDDWKNLYEKILEFTKDNNVPLVATNEVYYLNKEDKEARQTMLSIQSSLGTIESIEKNTADLSFLDSKDFIKLFEKHKDAVENIQKIVDKCDVEIKLGAWVFPDYKIESGLSPDDELKRLVYVGVEKKKMILDDYTKERIEYELSVIKQKGYAPYFLVVADLLKFSKENGILSNIRGSVSGSMVTYLSGITKINPIEYQIPFERFLNPERPSAPDIDMDYADDRRDEVVDYARRKYGNDKVAQIGTFGTMMARGAVRDVARALGYPYVIGDRLAKLIPMGQQGFPMTIDRAMEEVPELKEAYNKETDVKKIIDMAKKIEGCARHISIHAAGVVISPTLITDFVPLQYDPKGENKIITQYDMYAVEDAGLLKFDFLGLKNLTIITNTVKLIKKLSGTELDVDEIPIDDKKTFEMLARGETSDLFQLNGDGMTKYLKDLRPTTIHDINAMVALYRPGPIQFIPEYIARKHDRSKIFYLDPSLESILEKTYGILVYQDDLLMMANKLAGYSWGEVDKFRKAVGKKIPEEMAKQKEKFIQGCITYSNWPEAKARELWEWIEPFASYGFNKAHSVSYGRVAYITAYLKANYPGEYMRAVLNSEQGETEKVAESVVECERMGIEVLPPDINESFEEFTLIKPKEDKDKIRFGLTTIKNFGEGIAHIIVEERKANGIFKSLEDFLIRIKDRNLNKKSMEALVKCGAMDSFGERGEILANMEDLLLFNKESAKGLENQNSLFGAETEMPKSHLRLKKSEPAGQTEKLAWEKELLGLYVSGHPMDKYEEKFKKLNTNILKIKSINRDGISVLIGGLIENVRVINTKNGSPMAFVRISDKTSSMEIVAFPKLYEKDSKIFEVGQCIVCKGKLSKRGDDLSIIADQVKKVSE